MATSRRTNSTTKDKKNDKPVVAQISDQTSPLIFISHDTRDAELAEDFSKLLSSVSAGVLKSFRSSDRKVSQGIDYGVEWYPAIMKNLDMAFDVVCLLTKRSLDRPWILYEAGVAKGKLDKPVYGIALGIPLRQTNTGPFAQFQNSDDSEEALTKLVLQLMRHIPNSEPIRAVVQSHVREFKNRVSETLGKLDSSEIEQPSADEPSVGQLFEEVKIMFQDLPLRVDEKLKRASFSKSYRTTRPMPPTVRDEYMRYAKNAEPTVGFLMIISLIREDFPWLYEIGIEAFRSARNVDRKGLEMLTVRFHELTSLTLHLFRPRFGLKSNNTVYEMLDYLPSMLQSILFDIASNKSRKRKAQVDDLFK